MLGGVPIGTQVPLPRWDCFLGRRAKSLQLGRPQLASVLAAAASLTQTHDFPSFSASFLPRLPLRRGARPSPSAWRGERPALRSWRGFAVQRLPWEPSFQLRERRAVGVTPGTGDLGRRRGRSSSRVSVPHARRFSETSCGQSLRFGRHRRGMDPPVTESEQTPRGGGPGAAAIRACSAGHRGAWGAGGPGTPSRYLTRLQCAVSRSLCSPRRAEHCRGPVRPALIPSSRGQKGPTNWSWSSPLPVSHHLSHGLLGAHPLAAGDSGHRLKIQVRRRAGQAEPALRAAGLRQSRPLSPCLSTRFPPAAWGHRCSL